MKKRFLSLCLALALLLTACGGAADPASPETPPPSQSSAPPSSQEPAPVEPPPEEEPELSPPETGFVPVEQLNDKARQELSRYREGKEKYGFLYVVDREGEPVPNVHCYAGENAWNFGLDVEIPYDGRSGLSRNSGLLPVSFDLPAPAPLYLCNKDTILGIVDYQNEKPPCQRLEFDEESLERLNQGEVYQVVWEEPTPLETLLALDHVTVNVKNADGTPAADHVVYIHFRWEDIQPDPARGDVGPADSPYEPRYTDADGIARFVRENTFGTNARGYREIVVIPSYEEPKSPRKKAVHIQVPSEPPWDFTVTLPPVEGTVEEKPPFVIEEGKIESALFHPAPAEALCRYFTENVSPEDYLEIKCHISYTRERISYAVLIWAEDPAPFQKALESYSGDWTPVFFAKAFPFHSRKNLEDAETAVKGFLEKNPEIAVADVKRSEGRVVVRVKEENDALTEFVKSYPISGLIRIKEYQPENQVDLTVPLTDTEGIPLEGTAALSITVPVDWTSEGSSFRNAEGRQIMEVLSCIPFRSTGVYDKLAERYPDSDPEDVLVGGLYGKYFHVQTRAQDPAIAGTFQNEIIYYLERGDQLVCFQFYPSFGTGIGTQIREFQEAIKAIQ